MGISALITHIFCLLIYVHYVTFNNVHWVQKINVPNFHWHVYTFTEIWGYSHTFVENLEIENGYRYEMSCVEG